MTNPPENQADLLSQMLANTPGHAGPTTSPASARKTRAQTTADRIAQAIARIDDALSRQLAEILQHPSFRALESRWRGLYYLVHNTQNGENTQIQILPVSRNELEADARVCRHPSDSALAGCIWQTAESPSWPISLPACSMLVGDFAFSGHLEDVELLEHLGAVAVEGQCPIVAAASPAMFGLSDFADLPRLRGQDLLFESPDYIKWRAFRETEASRAVVLTLPRVLARLPYGSTALSTEAFSFEELTPDAQARRTAAGSDAYLWMNAAYPLAVCITRSVSSTGWFASFVGDQRGGEVSGLPLHTYVDPATSDCVAAGPCEAVVSERQDAGLADLGFASLDAVDLSDRAVFWAVPTAHRPKTYSSAAASADAKLTATLPCVLAAGQFVRMMLAVLPDGSSQDAAVIEAALRQQIGAFTQPWMDEGGRNMPAPLLAATVEVAAGKPPADGHVLSFRIRPYLGNAELQGDLHLALAV